MNKLAKIVAGLSIGLAAGCGKTETETVTVPVNPVIADYRAMNRNGKKVLLEDHLLGNEGNLIVFDAQSGNTKTLLQRQQNVYNSVQDSTIDRSAIEKWEFGPSYFDQTDVAFADLNNGTIGFDTNTPDRSERFLKFVNNGQTALIRETKYNPYSSSTQRVLAVDMNTFTAQNLFPDETIENVSTYNDLTTIIAKDVADVSRFYTIDKNGVKQSVFDTTIFPGTSLHNKSTPDVAIYTMGPNFTFESVQNGTFFNFVLPDYPNRYYDISGISQKEAIISEYDPNTGDANLFYIDLSTMTSKTIDFNSFPGWQPVTGGEPNQIIGNSKILIQGYGNENPPVLFYNKATGTLEDLLTPLTNATSIDILDFPGHPGYNGKALIETYYQTDFDTFFTTLYFDGNSLSTIGNYEYLRVEELSQDKRYALLSGDSNNNEKLIFFDIDTGLQKIIDADYVYRPKFSPDATKIFYTKYDNATNEYVLKSRDVAASSNQELARANDFIRILDVSKDGSTLAIERNDHLYRIDTTTGEETFVAYR